MKKFQVQSPRAHAATRILAGLLAVLASTPSAVAAEDGRIGFVLGKVFEVDKEAYRRYVESLRSSRPDFDERVDELDAERFLEERAEVTVLARHLATNDTYASLQTNGDGDYVIRESPVGAFDFTLLYEGVEYPVQQRLDLNVELSYVAELCFVLDREEQVAWMVTDGARRPDDVPPWVPRECLSAVSACLAMLTDTDGRFPDGLLLLLAGGGAAAVTLGILSTDQVEASPPGPPR